jgi:hypothetical protein
MQDHLFVYVLTLYGAAQAQYSQEPISGAKPPKYSLEESYLGVYYIASEKGP